MTFSAMAKEYECGCVLEKLRRSNASLCGAALPSQCTIIFFVYFRTRETRPRRSVQFILLGEPASAIAHWFLVPIEIRPHDSAALTAVEDDKRYL